MRPADRDVVIQDLMPLIPVIFRRAKEPYVFLLACGLILIMLFYAWVNPYEHGLLYPLLYATILTCLVVAAALGMPVLWGVHIAIFLGVFVCFYGVSQTGGIYSPQLTWSLVWPLVPFFVISRRAGYFWLLVALCFQVLIGFLTGDTRGFERIEFTNENSFISLFTYVVLAVFLGGVPVLYELMNRDALRSIRQRHDELTQKRLELEHISKMREQFISTISHELRTPMNAIMGFTALLTSHFHDDPGVLKILKHSEHSAEHLMTVINDILDYSQLHTGRLSAHAEKFELREAVHYAFELFLLRLEEGSVQYACDISDDVPHWVLTDRHRLMQILVNLLGNAIKFTQSGHVHLQVERCGQGVRFAVQDTGIGIADEQKSKIFQRYSQADETIQHRFGGNGLGLSISRKLTELLGGEMGFESTQHVGSTFWFTLPLQEQNRPKASGLLPAQKNIHSAEQAWRFLVVDDHQVNRLLVQQVLMNAWPRCEILEAEDGDQAIRQLETQHVDLVFMDMVMPVMDGIEATRVIKSRGLGGKDLAIVGLTANVNPVDLEIFRAAGLDALILKPFQTSALTAVVDGLLDKSSVCVAR
jgi:signal transduction histidine kinase